MVEVALPGRAVRWPAACACCLGEAPERGRIRGRMGLHAVSLAYPACADCKRHARLGVAVDALAIAAAVVLTPLGWYQAMHWTVLFGSPVATFAVFTATFAAVTAFLRWFAQGFTPGISEKCLSRTVPLDIVEPKRESMAAWALRIHNAAYAQRFQDANAPGAAASDTIGADLEEQGPAQESVELFEGTVKLVAVLGAFVGVSALAHFKVIAWLQSTRYPLSRNLALREGCQYLDCKQPRTVTQQLQVEQGPGPELRERKRTSELLQRRAAL